MAMLPIITLIEMDDGTCKVKADMTQYNKGVSYIHVKETQWRMLNAILKYHKGSLIQDCFHFLSPEEREFMLTGLTPLEQARFYEDLESSMGSVSVSS